MVFFVCFFICILFALFFYAIDLWYFGIFPLAFFVFMLAHSFQNVFSNVKVDEVWYKYSLLLIWILIMFWFSGLLFFVGIHEITIYLSLFVLNLFLWIGSYVFGYADGKRIFEIGSYLVMCIILGTLLISEGLIVFWLVFSLFSYFWFGFLGFLVFIMGFLYSIPKKYSYQLFLCAGLVLVTLNITIVDSLALWGLLSLLVLSGYYLLTFWVKQWKMPEKYSSMVSVRRILLGERIKKRLNYPQRKIALHTRISSSPLWFQRLLELPNLLILLIVIVNYFYLILSVPEAGLDLWYWLSLATFLLNIFLLKKIQYVSNISRFALALVVNFALYSALLKSWADNIAGILPFLVLWTFVCQIALFYIDRLKSRFMFSRKDYLYWTIVTCFASVVNVFLLFQLNLPSQFLFSLVFFYCGIELMVLYYIFQFLHSGELEKVEENMLKDEKKQSV